MKVLIIGGTGHIGTYLVPRLVEAGHQVVNISRNKRGPYLSDRAWELVEHATIDREEEEKRGRFGSILLDYKPDVVIDLICFTLDSATQLVKALHNNIQLLLHCGTIWVHGPSVQVPTPEEQVRKPFGNYGIKKAAIEAFLLAEARQRQFPTAILHPGHIVGQGWAPLNPAGNFNLDVFRTLANGRELCMANFGLETVHHVHADDVAQGFMKAMENWSAAIGESFHIVSPAALTLRGYAEAVASWFGQKANLRYLCWDDFKKTISEEDAIQTLEHISRSPNCSISKAKRLLNYQPRYSSLQAVKESIEYLSTKGLL